MKTIEFKYNVLTRETGPAAGLDPSWWMLHPDWNFYCRTDVRSRWSSSVWLGGGGATEEEAVAAAEQSVRCDKAMMINYDCQSDMAIVATAEARGVKTDEVIANGK